MIRKVATGFLGPPRTRLRGVMLKQKSGADEMRRKVICSMFKIKPAATR